MQWDFYTFIGCQVNYKLKSAVKNYRNGIMLESRDFLGDIELTGD